MQKIIAVLVSISILSSQLPVVAQVGPTLRNTSRAVAKKAASRSSGSLPATNYVLKSAQNPISRSFTAPFIQLPPAANEVRPPLLSPAQTAQIQAALTRSAQESLQASQLSFEQILHRANQGKTAFLPTAILRISNLQQRSQLLRTAFVTAAAAGDATEEQLTIAQRFWRVDLAQKREQLARFIFTTDSSTEDLLPVVQALQDVAALALLGTAEDVPFLQQVFADTKGSALESFTAALLARGLLSRENWSALETFFVQNNGKFAPLQNGIAAYVQQEKLPVQLTIAEAAASPLSNPVSPLLQGWGPVLASAAQPQTAATQQWMKWAKNQKGLTSAPAPAADKKITAPILTKNLEELLPETTAGALSLQPAALPQQAGLISAAKKTILKVPSTVNSGLKLVQPTPLWKWLKQHQAALKAADKNKMPAPDNSLLAHMQRGSLYMASFVMGLEVATPVIANFGTSFDLPLEDNILVAAATYTPYSIGALLSNYTKKWLGRKGSMNLGLAMMGAGLLGGVNWVGLDGSFAAEADTMHQFYKALACITLASTGGVFIHNSVGPIMMELNAKASDLVRQRRSTFTELSRALGMASSFAFPFIATKMLGMDWSFTFALPIPLVAGALLGTSLIRLPNTRPIQNQAAKAAHQIQGSLWNAFKNNEYFRLFKEEKGAGALLTGLAIMNAVEMGINNGFMFMLPSLTKDPSSQYLFGMAQFAAPFILGRYLAKRFLSWFPKRNLSVSMGLAATGSVAALLPGIVDNVYALTGSLFLAETGISTLFTLSYARTAKNPATVDRLTSLIVASALSCAVGPLMFSKITQLLMNAGMSANPATAAAMIGIPAGLTLLSTRLFRKVEALNPDDTPSSLRKLTHFIKNSLYFPKFRRKRS